MTEHFDNLGEQVEKENLQEVASSVDLGQTASFRYLNRMAFHPQIYTNSTTIERIEGPYREEIPRFDSAKNLISKGIVTIDGTQKLRAYDDDVFTAIFKLMEENGNFDEIEFSDGLTNVAMQKMIDECRHLNCQLDDILNIMDITCVNNNRFNLCESLKTQRAITFSFQEISNTGDVISSETHGLISSCTFDTNNLTKIGRITIDDKIVEQIIRGNFTWINFYEYKKVPRGIYRKFFRYIHSLFKNKECYEIPYEELRQNILGINYSSERRNMHEFMVMARWFEQHKLIQYGFSADSKFRIYNLIESREDGKWVILKRGDYFLNIELHPLPSADTMDKTTITTRLCKMALNKQYEDLYLAACGRIAVSPIKEKARGDKPETVIYTNTVEGGIILEKLLPSGEKITENRPLTWDILSKYLYFIELFELVEEEKIRSKPSFLRSMVENQQYFSEQKLADMEKKFKNKKKDCSIKVVSKVSKVSKNENLNSEDLKKSREEIHKEFLKIVEGSTLQSEHAKLIHNFITKLCGKTKVYDTWFSKVEIIRWNGFIVFCTYSSLAMDYIKSRYLGGILEFIQREIDKEAKLDVWTMEQFIEDYKIKVP